MKRLGETIVRRTQVSKNIHLPKEKDWQAFLKVLRTKINSSSFFLMSSWMQLPRPITVYWQQKGNLCCPTRQSTCLTSLHLIMRRQTTVWCYTCSTLTWTVIRKLFSGQLILISSYFLSTSSQHSKIWGLLSCWSVSEEEKRTQISQLMKSLCSLELTGVRHYHSEAR